MSHNSNYQHIVFRTYKSRKTLPDLSKLMLLKYIEKLCSEKGIYYRNGNAHRNHVHLLLDIPSSISIEEAVTLIKSNSSKILRGHRLFPNFEKWAKKYGAFSISYSHMAAVSGYIDNQEKHHEGVNFYEEFKRLVEKNGGQINEYFEEDFGKDDSEEECL